MFYSIIEPVIVSIAVSIFASWVGLIPKYPKWRQLLTMQLINTIVLSILLSVLNILEIHFSWLLLFVTILAILWLSVRLTRRIFNLSETSATSSSKDVPPSE